MKVTRFGQILCAICKLFVLPAFASQETSHVITNLPGSRVIATAADLPSALWPQFVTAKQDIKVDGKGIKSGNRGILLRCELNTLVVDFGRHGIVKISPALTDFYDKVMALMKGKEKKQYPNLTLQIGNKMMTFGRGDESGPIRFEDAQSTELYVLLYLDLYSPGIAQELMDFGLAYTELKSEWPMFEVVLMPKDREFYNFGFTVGYQIPFIATHMRLGYIKSLAHGVEKAPGFVVLDPNGRILGRSDTPIEWSQLAKALEGLLNNLGIQWTAPRIKHRRAYQRSANWNN